MHHIFEAFEWTPFSKVKVVILVKILIMDQTKLMGVVFSTAWGAGPAFITEYLQELQRFGCPVISYLKVG